MSKQIWKYEIPIPKTTIEMPIGAEILCVQMQNDTPCIWAIVDTDQEKQERYFETFGTGHELPTDMGIDRKYIGTFQMYNGNLVMHLFEKL